MGLLDFLPSRRRIARLETQLAQSRRLTPPQSSGAEITFGKFDREFTSAMKGSKKWDTLDKMQADPHVKGGIDGAVLPLLTAQWDITPASDDPRDIEIAEFCAANLLRRSGDSYGKEYWTATGWQQRLLEILDMLASGFSVFHKTWRVVGDKVVYDRLTWLEPRTIDSFDGWVVDEDTGDLLGITRAYTTNRGQYVRRRVDVGELALYAWEMRGQRFDGNPLLRSLYGPWFRKDFMAKIAAINVQKIGSPIPIVQYPQDMASDSDKYESLAKMMRGQSPDHAYWAGSKGMNGEKADIDWAAPSANEVDRVGKLIDRENLEIAHGAGRKSQMLGETTSGSRALGDTQMSAEVLRWRAIAEWVCETETHGTANMPGLIEELVDRNFSNVRKYPRLVAGRVDPLEQTGKLEALIKAKQAGLVPAHPSVMRQVSEAIGIELPDDVYDQGQERIEQMPPPQDDPGRGRPPQEREEPDDNEPSGLDGDALFAAEGDLRRRLSALLQPIQEGAPKGGGFRYPTHFEERFVNLARVQDRQRTGGGAVTTVLRDAHRAAVVEVVGRLESGKLIPRNIESQRRSKFRKAGKFKSRLVSVLDDVGADGAAHAAAELKRQVNSLDLVNPDDVDVGGGGLLEPAIVAFDETATITADLWVERAWRRVITEGVDEYARLARQGLDPIETERQLRAFLDGLSEKPLEDLGRQASSVAYNAGRTMTLVTAKKRDVATHAVRSEEVLGNTMSSSRRRSALAVTVVAAFTSESATKWLTAFPGVCSGHLARDWQGAVRARLPAPIRGRDHDRRQRLSPAARVGA